jgi:hypothetical protein
METYHSPLVPQVLGSGQTVCFYSLQLLRLPVLWKLCCRSCVRLMGEERCDVMLLARQQSPSLSDTAGRRHAPLVGLPPNRAGLSACGVTYVCLAAGGMWVFTF